MTRPSYRDYRLPQGRHGLSPAQVAANQRWRLIGAASDVLADNGLIGVTIRSIARRAGVSVHTFYEHFDSVDDVLIAAFGNASELLAELAASAYAGAGSLEEGRRLAVDEALALGAREPALSALMRMELAVGVRAIGVERDRLVSRLDGLAGGARGGSGRISVAAVLGLVVERLERHSSAENPEFSREVSAMPR